MHPLTFFPLFPLVQAWKPPNYPSYTLLFSDSFAGPSGSLPNKSHWNIIDGFPDINNELQTYIPDSRYVQHSGGETLQLVPWQNNATAKGWASGRVESSFTFKPSDGKKTMIEASISLGDYPLPVKRGIAPSFFLQGERIRRGTEWPACGEFDVMQVKIGLDEDIDGFGTMHCDVHPGGICNEPKGLQGVVEVPGMGHGWNRWRVVWDRTGECWECERAVWYLNGEEYWAVEGKKIGNEVVWEDTVREDMFFVLGVAVGGDWAGSPTEETADGYGSMMEVGYVAFTSLWTASRIDS
ncbi:putative endo-1,3(4)-beta-glucanase [Immersiella caudata]|uniref:Endo-1,3(4)-beta-glucanase n=1 Tax=Immersiella caudata TaxID=314043 RepID=A0AA39WYM6_9PEZI|nr:putative endo-1,3(4)-beta-glucanase [Immersiella caudata]